jgi:hypothetical protein
VLFGRLHSPSFKADEEVQLRKSLGKVVPILGDGWNAHPILQSLLVKGSVEQGVRVVRMLASLNIAVEIESFDMLGLDRENALPLLEALAERNEGADRLAAWLVGKPHLVTEGGWPMRSVFFICNRIPAAKFGDRALLSQLADLVLAGVHSTSFRERDRADAMEALARLQAGGANFAAVRFLDTGDPEQRIRVLDVLSELNVDIGRHSPDQLAQHLWAESIRIIPHTKGRLCKYFKQGRCEFGYKCEHSHNWKDEVCKYWMGATCTFGSSCRYMHGETKSLLTLVLEEEQKRKSSGLSRYLLDLLKPKCTTLAASEFVPGRSDGGVREFRPGQEFIPGGMRLAATTNAEFVPGGGGIVREFRPGQEFVPDGMTVYKAYANENSGMGMGISGAALAPNFVLQQMGGAREFVPGHTRRIRSRGARRNKGHAALDTSVLLTPNVDSPGRACP